MASCRTGRNVLSANTAQRAIFVCCSIYTPAWADTIYYIGTNALSSLTQDSVGDRSPYLSLVPVSKSGNTVTVDGVTTDGSQSTWSVDPSAAQPTAPYVIYGGVDVAPADKMGTNTNGADGVATSNNIVVVKNVRYDWATGSYKAPNGTVTTVGTGAGGIGGLGGASVFGGVSLGGAGGYLENVQGGAGGSASSNTVTLTNVSFYGAQGGNGGSGYGGAGGIGGSGGASIGGGFSVGGSGGSGDSASGGDGGMAAHNTVILTRVMLTGAAGGDGGNGSAGGFGGASVFGGASMGGASGSSDIDNANGGTGGLVAANHVSLLDVTLNGGAGGNAGNSYGSGIAGTGGASVYGGVSIGGTGAKANIMSANGGDGGNVMGNTVTLTKVILNGGIGGNSIGIGYSGGGIGGLGGGSVYGGVSFGGAGGESASALGGNGGEVAENTVTLLDVTLNGARGGIGGSYGGGIGGLGGASVYGGISLGGTGGQSAIDEFSVRGVGSAGGYVHNNTVMLTNVTLNGARGGIGVIGGLGGASIAGGLSLAGVGEYSISNSSNLNLDLRANGGIGGNVMNNVVTLANVRINGAQGGDSYNGMGGLGGGTVYGGISIGGGGGMSGGGGANISADGGAGGNVYDNKVLLNDVTISGAQAGASAVGIDGLSGGSVFGGFSLGGVGGTVNFYSASSVSANGGVGGMVRGNRISISGKSSISGDVYGGYSHGGKGGWLYNQANNVSSSGTDGAGGAVTNNTVTLEGTQIVIGKTDTTTNAFVYGSVYGGLSLNGDNTSSSVDMRSGNTLRLIAYRGSLNGIYNFQNYYYVLPKSVVNGDTLVHIMGSAPVNLADTTHRVGAMYNDGNLLKAGDKLTLIDWVANSPRISNLKVEQGHFLVYDMSLQQEDRNGKNALVLTVDGGKLSPKFKAYPEGRAAALSLVNQGADLIADHNLRSMRSMLGAQNGIGNFLPFLLINGGSSRYNTGSHVDLDSYHLATGLAHGVELEQGHLLTTGAYFEYGRGSYSTYNNFSDGTYARGYGNTSYTGGGAYMRLEFAKTGLGRVLHPTLDVADGFYLEAGVRAGRSKLSFDSKDLTDGEGYRGAYEGASTYVGIQSKLGYVFNFDAKQALDMYARYAWLNMKGDTVLVGKDRLSFDEAQSMRLRVGSRYSYAYSDQVQSYVGIAYEHEFRGGIEAQTYGFAIDTPTLSGAAGILEAGFKWQPLAPKSGLHMEMKVQGYIGDRRGGNGALRIRYQF